MGVVSASMYKAARQIASGITEQDANITAAISSAEQFIEAETGRKLASDTHTEYFDIRRGQTVIHLSHWPVTTFTSLSWRNASTWTAYSSSAYYAPTDQNDRGTVQYLGTDYPYGTRQPFSIRPSRKGYALPEGHQTIRAVYVAGFTTDSLAVSLREPFYRVVDYVAGDFGRVWSALSDGFSGTLRTNRTAADEGEIKAELLRPFRSVVL